MRIRVHTRRPRPHRPLVALALGLAACLSLWACASAPKGPDAAEDRAQRRARDPFEVAQDWLTAARQDQPGQGAPAQSLQAQALARMHQPALVRLLRAQDGQSYRAVIAERDEPPKGQALVLTLAKSPTVPGRWQVQSVALHDARAYWPRF